MRVNYEIFANLYGNLQRDFAVITNPLYIRKALV